MGNMLTEEIDAARRSLFLLRLCKIKRCFDAISSLWVFDAPSQTLQLLLGKCLCCGSLSDIATLKNQGQRSS